MFKVSYALPVQARINNKKTWFHEFWWLTEIFNQSKLSVPTLMALDLFHHLQTRLGSLPQTPKAQGLWFPYLSFGSFQTPQKIWFVLSPMLIKLFNCCLKRNVTPVCRSCQPFTLFSRMLVSVHFPHSITSSASLVSLANSDIVISKEVVNHLIRNHLLSNKQYRFHSFRSTADVLSVITQIMNELLNDSFIPRAFVLNISKT